MSLFDRMISVIDATDSEKEAEAAWDASIEAKKAQAIKDNEAMRENTAKFLKSIGKIKKHIDDLAASAGAGKQQEISNALDDLGALHKEFHDLMKLERSHDATSETDGSAAVDEANGNAEAATYDGASTRAIEMSGPAITDIPMPDTRTTYADIADEYVAHFNGARIAPGKEKQVQAMVKLALKHKQTYLDIGNKFGIPWWFIAGLHQMESTYNFEGHLHNGDSLKAKTVNVPADRPDGDAPFTFAESAKDALKMKGFADQTDWSLPRALYRFEKYNGWGYRKYRGIPSPYLWSFTTLYDKGKYVSDGSYDEDAVSQQCGVAALLVGLATKAPKTKTVEFQSRQFKDTDAAADGALIDGADTTNRDDSGDPNEHPFKKFWHKNLSDVQDFDWTELLFKGARHNNGSVNSDPPERLFQNVALLVRILQKIRTQFEHPVNLLSVYRDETYNSFVGGKPASRHLMFDAADFHVVGDGRSTQDWADFAKKLRQEGEFEGGVGIYSSFVHIDMRGTRANWDMR